MRPRGSSSEQYYNGQRENPNPPKKEQSSTSEKKQKNRNTHGASVFAKTNAFGLVSIILIIGMIATMFFAVSYSGKQQFKYFSPSTYLRNLSSTYVVIPDTWASLNVYVFNVGNLGWYTSFAEVIINDVRYTSAQHWWPDNKPPTAFTVYEFNIGGNVLYSEAVSVGNDDEGNPIYKPFLHVPGSSYDIFAFPDISTVADAWSNVDGLMDGTLASAFRVTGLFIKDSLRFEIRIFEKLLPWNSVVDADRKWIDDIWINAEIRNS